MYRKKAFALGDIVVSEADEDDRAIVVRVIYAPRTTATSRARELLLLMELSPGKPAQHCPSHI